MSRISEQGLKSVFLPLLLLAVFLPPDSAASQEKVFVPQEAPPRIHPLPTLREQARIQQGWANKRTGEVIPILMGEHDVDMWILSMQEYEEDPVFWGIKAPTTFAARRRSIYVFHDPGHGQPFEKLALGGGAQGGIFEAFTSARAADARVSRSWWATSSGTFFGNWSRTGTQRSSP